MYFTISQSVSSFVDCLKDPVLHSSWIHFTSFGIIFNDHVLYILTSVWVLRMPNADQNMLFQYFCVQKSFEKAYFDQRLELAAPNHWSKYTIIMGTD